MKNHKRFFIIVGIVGAALIFSLLKSSFITSSKRSSGMKITGQELSGLDLRPFARSNNSDNRLTQTKLRQRRSLKRAKSGKMLRSAGLMKAQKHTFDHKDDKKKKDKKKKDKDKKKEKKKKKKKKDKKKDKKKKTPKYDVEDDDSDSGDDSADANTGGVFSNGPAVADNNNGIPVTFEEWAALLLDAPNKKATEEFISYFQTNMVSSEVFYSIVSAMLADGREEMAQLGIVAAGATPSYRSFMALTNYMQTQSYSSATRTRALGEVQRDYASLQSLRTLESVLSLADSAFAVTLAANSVGKMAQKYLQPVKQKTPRDPDALTHEPGKHPYASRFSTVRTLLERIISEGGDTQVVDAASKSLQTIENLLTS